MTATQILSEKIFFSTASACAFEAERLQNACNERRRKGEKKDEEIKSIQSQADQLKKDYNNLKLAKMIEISDTDFKEAKQKITYLVREVNACINLLNAQ